MSISLIVCTRNHAEYVRHLVRQLQELELTDVDVLWADRGSTDDTRDIAADHGTVVELSQAASLAQALNAGAKAAQSPYLVFLRPDVILPSSDWLSAIRKAFDEQDADIVNTRMAYADGATLYNTGVTFDGQGNWEYLHLWAKTPLYSACVRASEACWAIRRSLWESIDGFDEDLRENLIHTDAAIRAGVRRPQATIKDLFSCFNIDSLLRLEAWEADRQVFERKHSDMLIYEKTRLALEQEVQGLAENGGVEQLQDIIGRYQNMVSAGANSAQVHNDLGVLYAQTGDTGSALEHLQTAVALDPTSILAHRNLADIYYAVGDYNNARIAYKRLLELAPSDLESLLQLTNIYVTIERLEDAEMVCRKLSEFHPCNPLAKDLLDSVSAARQDVEQSQATDDEHQDDEQVNVSIVIPVFNKVHFTRACLEKLYANTPQSTDFEVVVVDNGSIDETAAFLEEASQNYPGLRVVTNFENQGFARACNKGARTARGRYILFLNNDTEVQPGWLEPMVEILDADRRVGMVGSRLLFPNGTIQHAGVVLVQNKETLLPLHVYFTRPANLPEACEPRTYQALTGACILVRREVFEAVGGFDASYWNSCEDTDLCLKMREQGYLLVYEPNSVVVHHESQSGPERHAKDDANFVLFQSRWRGKVAPDCIANPDGSFSPTKAAQIGKYERPAAPPAPKVRSHARWFSAPDWKRPETWWRVVEEYARSKDAEQGTVLQLYAGMLTRSDPEDALRQVSSMLEQLGIDDDNCADIEITSKLPESGTTIILSGGPLDGNLRLQFEEKCVSLSGWQQAA